MSNEERQRNELELLQSMYEQNLNDLRTKSPWNQWTPLNLSITLIPQQGSAGTQEIHVQTDLQIICTNLYPDSVPQIILKNSKGLSNTLLVQLQNELEDKAESLKGEVMIYELVQHVQEFLHRHNKPSSKSFYEEMLKSQKEKEKRELEARELEKNKQRQTMIEEVQKRQEYLKKETRKRRESKFYEEGEDGVDNNKSTDSSDESLCAHSPIAVINFGDRIIKRGKCLKHSSPQLIIFSGLDTDSGEMVQISEWTIKLKDENEVSVVQRQISSIEQEFGFLLKLKHQNIAQYQNIKSDFLCEENKFVIYVIQEFILGSNCYTLFVSQKVKVDTDLLKYISKGVLMALDYLHRNNVAHKQLSDTCVYLSNKGIKVSKYSIQKRLFDLISPSPANNINYGKKTDIYNYGIFLLTLLQGSPVNSENLEIPSSLDSDLYDLLQKCLAKDDKERLTTTQLLKHQFFRKPVVHFPPNNHLVEVVKDQGRPMAEVQDDLEILSQYQSNSKCRINQDFETIEHLGRGAFGDVIKVRNKLDGGYYAIKRIKLNPKNRQLNKKIVREVKLLSRLNHENVVRYYNSWVETTKIKKDEAHPSDTASDTASDNDVYIPKVVRQNEFTLNDSDIEDLAPPVGKNVEVSVTYDSKSQPAFNSDDDSSDDELFSVYQKDPDSYDIEFAHDSSESKVESTSSQTSDQVDSCQENTMELNFMYIQMEFCEKSTLRIAIDNNLYLDENRVWRLFREIVEGLAHIHQQGMIHRDLKPVNIFLDSEDHVKIGDFGLATTAIKSKGDSLAKSPIESERETTVDESKTGIVGTALYVAPEIVNTPGSNYHQYVDIYSLGIIFFEMCYRPLQTAMERIKILTGLRTKEIIIPEDFLNTKSERHTTLVKLLLTHDFAKRPTSSELLQSDYLPPPVLEECELQELIRHTISNPHLKGYKHLMMSCFQQSMTPAQDITYDKDPTSSQTSKDLRVFDFVRQKTIQVFKKHGGQNLTTPLLMPKSAFYENMDTYVKLMTHYGGIVSLPHDLRVPFARYIAWNGIQLFRRYSVERVYRERKMHGFLPRELFECAFDIVSPTSGNLMSDAEILYTVYEIIKELPVLKTKHVVIRLNHTLLLKAILLHCGIKENHNEVYKTISEIKQGKVPKIHMQDYLVSLGLSDSNINTFMNLINSECDCSKLSNQFQVLTKKKSNESSQMAKQAIQDLKLIAQNAEAFGNSFEIIITPSLVYNIQQYSGMICQFVCDVKKKRKHSSMEVVAAGGRYDSMIASYRNIMLQANMLDKDIQQSAVGISISLDKLVQALKTEEDNDLKINNLDVAVCSIGSKPMLKEKAKVLNMLWSAGLRCCLIESTILEEIHEEVNELKAPHTVIIKEDQQVLIQSWGTDRLHEKVVPIGQLVAELTQIVKDWRKSSVDQTSNAISRSESRVFHSEYNHGLEIVFSTEKKLSSNARKKYENQVQSHLETLLKKMNGPVIVIGVSLEANVIRTVTSYLEFETESRFEQSVQTIMDRHQRHKKYIYDVCTELYKYKQKRTQPIIVLISINDYFYKVIL